MTPWLTFGALAVAALLSLLFSTLTFALRDFSRTRLTDELDRRGKADSLDWILSLREDLVYVTAVARLLANIVILVCVLHFLVRYQIGYWLQYLIAIAITGIITLISSVAIPHALAQHTGEKLISAQIGFIRVLYIVLLPATRFMHWINHLVASGAGIIETPTAHQAEQELQEEILSVVEEGEKDGVVDEQERSMIVSVIQFRDTAVSQVMTARPDIVGMPIGSSLEQVKQVVEQSGHSRIPVFEGTLDHIIGVLYARDLIKHLGLPPEQFDIRSAMRPAFYVPETKPLRDLLQDFRLQKVHIAIVLDEYGGTAGLVSIEDVLEELVGDISDEHEPHEPSMIKRIDEHTFEADARVRLEELNRTLQLKLPEDAGVETLGGYVSSMIGRIPQTGTKFDQPGMRFTILEAEPQRVNRVKVEMLPPPAANEAAATAS